jgi:hypothetical protein
VTARGELEFGEGIVCSSPAELFELYDRITEGAVAVEVIAEINSHGGMCLWSHLYGAQGPIVAGKTYPTARIDVQEVTIHAQMPLAGGDWVHYDPPRRVFNGRLNPFVSELPWWIPRDAQQWEHAPQVPIVPTTCRAGLEVYFGKCRPDCRFGPCGRRRIA